MSARRKLRLSPRHVMTGDVIIERVRRPGRSLTGRNVTEQVETLVTNIEPVERPGRPIWWRIEGVHVGTGSTGWDQYAVQRRLTVFRTGPKGLGE